jgi:hypothetical protein
MPGLAPSSITGGARLAAPKETGMLRDGIIDQVAGAGFEDGALNAPVPETKK